MRSELKALVFVALLAVVPQQKAGASLITLDFNDLAPTPFQTTNLTYNGFRFSPNCHYDLVAGDSSGSSIFPATNWMGFDGSNCGSTGLPYQTYNPEFLGPTEYQVVPGQHPTQALWVDFGGRPFSLESLDAASVPIAVSSSKGGYLSFSDYFFSQTPPLASYPRIDFSGGDWNGITWLLFTIPSAAGLPLGFDNLTVRAVPEPGTLALLGLGLAGLGLSQRRKA